MNHKLIQDFRKKKIVLFNGKVIPVLGTVDYKNNPHLILGERSRSVLGTILTLKNVIALLCIKSVSLK